MATINETSKDGGSVPVVTSGNFGGTLVAGNISLPGSMGCGSLCCIGQTMELSLKVSAEVGSSMSWEQLRKYLMTLGPAQDKDPMHLAQAWTCYLKDPEDSIRGLIGSALQKESQNDIPHKPSQEQLSKHVLSSCLLARIACQRFIYFGQKKEKVSASNNFEVFNEEEAEAEELRQHLKSEKKSTLLMEQKQVEELAAAQLAQAKKLRLLAEQHQRDHVEHEREMTILKAQNDAASAALAATLSANNEHKLRNLASLKELQDREIAEAFKLVALQKSFIEAEETSRLEAMESAECERANVARLEEIAALLAAAQLAEISRLATAKKIRLEVVEAAELAKVQNAQKDIEEKAKAKEATIQDLLQKLNRNIDGTEAWMNAKYQPCC